MNTTEKHSNELKEKILTDPKEIKELLRSDNYWKNNTDTTTARTKNLSYESNHILVDKQGNYKELHLRHESE